MARHRSPILSFDYPRDWEDRSEVRYEAPTRPAPSGAASPGRAVVRRSRLLNDETLLSFVERELRVLAALDGFVIREVLETRVEERSASLVRYATLEASVPYEHRLLFVPLSDRGVALFTLSAPRSEQAQLEPLFERMLASVAVGDA